jgi:hypothetical protein
MGIYYLGSNLRLESELANSGTFTVATSADKANYRIQNVEDPYIKAEVSWDGTTANVTWIQGASVSDQDVSNKMCIYVSGGNLLLKNNLGSTKNFVIFREA